MEDYEISVQELSKRDADSYILIDIRDDSSYSYGNIPGSLHVPKDILEADYEKYKDKPLILYCKKGETSAETVQFLKREKYRGKKSQRRLSCMADGKHEAGRRAAGCVLRH